MLIKRIKYAGDIFEALVKQCEWDIDTASAFLESIPDAPNASLRPKGEWITASFWKSRKGHHVQLVFKKCSLCNFRIKARWENNFCPNCGADMRLAGASPRPTDGGERDS